MRILSLLPAATEIVYLLDLEKNLVGVSHECDYPKEAKNLPKVTSSPVSNKLSSKEINSRVALLSHRGSGVFHIKDHVLKKLKPDLILTQELCEVCAVPWSQVSKSAKLLEGDTKIISLEPKSLDDILTNIRIVGQFGNKEVDLLIKSLHKRLNIVKSKLPRKAKKVLIIEWLEPLMIAGHWVPEMVEKAGGENLITIKGDRSYPINEDQIGKTNPDIIIFAPCGFNIERTFKEKHLIERLKSYAPNAKFYLADGDSYFTRPGPRIIDGVEILAEIIYPEIFPKKHSKADWRFFTI